MADAIVEIFGDNDPFKKGRDSAKTFLKVIDDMVKKSKVLGTTFRKELNSINFKGLKDVQKFNAQIEGLNKTLKSTNQLRETQVNINKKVRDSQKQSNKVTADGVKLEKESIKVSKQSVATTNEEILAEQKKGVIEREAIRTAKEASKLKAEESRTRQTQLRGLRAEVLAKDRARKASEKEKRTILQSTNAYKKLTRVTNAAQFQFKSLAAQFGINSKEAQNALTRLNKLDGVLRKINNTARDGRRDVGRYGLATKGLGLNFKSLATGLVGGLGVVEGLRLVADLFREGFKVSKEFGLAIAKVGALSGANAQQLASLTNEAKELGATTQFTAAQVANLQTELAKLGFDPTQIQDSTKAILDFAVATGSELARSGEVVAATLNAFNLNASEAGRVADVAAKAFSSSALDIEKFSTSISAVGPASNAVGVSLERTTAILGKIVDSGIDASTAGTALRNVFITLSDKGLTFAQAMDQINNSQDSLLKANELFGKRGAVVATVIANNTEAIDDLDIALQNAEGSAANTASILGDTLDGDVKKLQSAFEGLLLGGGFLDVLFRNFIKSITLLLSLFTKFGSAIEGITGNYKDLNETLAKQNDLRVLGVIENKRATASAEDLLTSYEDLNDEENLTIEQKEELAEVQDDLIDLYGRSALKIDEETGELILNVKAIRAKIAAQRALESEEASTLLQEEAKINVRVRRLRTIRSELEAINLSTVGELKDIQLTGNELVDALAIANNEFEKLAGLSNAEVQSLQEAALRGTTSFNSALLTLKNSLGNTTEGIGVLNNLNFLKLTGELGDVASFVDETFGDTARLAEIDAALKLLGVTFEDLESQRNGGGGLGDDEAIIGAINNQRKLLEGLRKEKDEANEEDIKQKEEAIRVAELELKRLVELGDASLLLKKSELDLERDSANQRIAINAEADRKIAEFRLLQISSNNLEDIEKAERQIELIERKRKEDGLLLDIEINERKKDLIITFGEVVANGEQKIFKIEKDNIKKRQELKENALKDGADDRALAISEEENEEEAKTKKLKENLDDRLQLIEDFEENVSKLLDLVQQGLANQTQARLDGITRSLEENRKIQDELRQDAKDGNLEAQESLTIQKKKEAELEQERLRLEKQQRQRELAFAFLKILNTNLTTYQAKVEEARATKSPIPPNTVLVDTLTQGSLLAGAITTGFIDGTENVGRSMGNAPLDGAFDNYVGSVGGKVFKFDGDEAILNPAQNKKRGGLSNDKTVDIAHRYLKGDLIEKSKVFDTAIAMTNALSSLRMTKESSNLDLMIRSLTGEMKGLRGDLRGLPSKMPTSHSGFNNKTGFVEHINKKLGREEKVLERLNRS